MHGNARARAGPRRNARHARTAHAPRRSRVCLDAAPQSPLVPRSDRRRGIRIGFGAARHARVRALHPSVGARTLGTRRGAGAERHRGTRARSVLGALPGKARSVRQLRRTFRVRSAPVSADARSLCRAVLFDLDGTLLDTAGDLAQALNRLRAECALPPLGHERIRSFVSHGATALVRLAFPSVPEAEFLKLRARLLELYGAALCVHTRAFPGMLELIARLEQDGVLWGIVTNKPA